MTSKLLSDLLKSTKGCSALARAMTAPLMQRKNYSSIARRALITTYECEVCKRYLQKMRFFNEDFSKAKVSYSDFVLGGRVHRICYKCARETHTRLSLVNELALDRMPLYINDENIFIEKRAIERLKKGR